MNSEINIKRISGLQSNSTLRTNTQGQIYSVPSFFKIYGFEATNVDNVANQEVTSIFSKSPSDSVTTIERLSNGGAFRDGAYFTKITQLGNLQGQGVFFTIPEQHRVGGRNLRLYITYKSTEDIETSAYLKNGGTFINNGGRSRKTLLKSTSESEFFIDRKYESGANIFNLFFDQNVGAIVDISTVYLMIESDIKKDPFVNVIEIDNNGVDSYNLITSTLRGYNESVVYGENHFEFIVKQSSAPYYENDIRGLNSYRGSERGVVVLRSEIPLGATIIADGNSDNENFRTPSDYFFAGEENKLMKDVPTHKKHAFWLHESMDVKGFVIHAIDCKYCVHQDANGQMDSLFENNYFIQEKINDLVEWRVIGLGTRFNQKARYYNNVGEFRNNTGNPVGIGNKPMLFFWHNDNNEIAPTLLECKDNKSINCGIGLFSEIGSNQPDVVILENNTTNLTTEGIEIQNHELNTNNGYNLNFKIKGSLNYFKLRDRAGGRENLDIKSLPINNYLFPFYNGEVNTISQGVAVVNNYATGKMEVATGAFFDGVVWRDAVNTGYYVPKGKAVDALCYANGTTTYLKGLKLTVNGSGLFKKAEPNESVVAICLQDAVLISEGILKIKIL